MTLTLGFEHRGPDVLAHLQVLFVVGAVATDRKPVVREREIS
jgi:hypothetical protein